MLALRMFSAHNCNQGSKWDSMDQYGVPTLSWPPGKHTGAFFWEKTYWYACEAIFFRFRQRLHRLVANIAPA